MRIGIDIMGGDYSPDAPILGSILASKEIQTADHKLVLIGEQEVISKALEKEKVDPNRFEICNATEVIEMGDHPTKAYTQKPNSSIAVGFGLLQEKKIDGFCSVGNTGAMLVGALYSVKAITGVIRPCVTSILPKENGGVGIILDVGTNADCRPDVLYQFGILGSVFAEMVYQIDNPKIGLLNIGEEQKKGNLLTQAAHNLMSDSKDFNFIGNVEGRDLFSEKVDVIVCDGFTGNIVLKEAEAFYALIKKRGLSDAYFDRFNYEIYGGTPILGVNGNVIIGHGISSAEAIKNMILLTLEISKVELHERIKQAF